MNRQRQQQIQSILLDSVTTCAVIGLIGTNPTILNPWHLSFGQWCAGAVLVRGAIVFYDHLVVFAVETIMGGLIMTNNTKDDNDDETKTKKKKNYLLPTRMTGKPVRYVSLDLTSYIFLTINSIDEYIFVQRLCHYIWYNSALSSSSDDDSKQVTSLDWHDLTISNTVGALIVMFIVLDACYAPLHHLLHLPALYPLIHKHHHRQHYPVRGYLDAGNEHPIEHYLGIVCTWAALLAAVHGPTGAHGYAIVFFFNVHAALAMLNHSPYNVKFDLLPPAVTASTKTQNLFQYSVANHEMHHRKFTVNYAQYCMWYDHLMNTYAAYEGPSKAGVTAEASETTREEIESRKDR